MAQVADLGRFGAWQGFWLPGSSIEATTAHVSAAAQIQLHRLAIFCRVRAETSAYEVLAAGLRATHDHTLMGNEMVDRVRAHTAPDLNEKLDREAERRIMYAAGQPPAALSRRIEELDREWDMERWLEANAATLAFTGTLLGILVNRKFLAIPCFVLPFLFQHATQGWCPPVPILRRNGVRTRREIDGEKYALKALRGDFREVSASRVPSAAARIAWAAAGS